MSFAKVVSDDDFEKIVLENTKPSFVDFWAPWCGPCRMIEPLIEKLAEDYYGDIDVFKMNIDGNSDIPTRLQIRSIPNMMMFYKGEILDTVVGAPDPQVLVDLFERAVDEAYG